MMDLEGLRLPGDPLGPPSAGHASLNRASLLHAWNRTGRLRKRHQAPDPSPSQRTQELTTPRRTVTRNSPSGCSHQAGQRCGRHQTPQPARRPRKPVRNGAHARSTCALSDRHLLPTVQGSWNGRFMRSREGLPGAYRAAPSASTRKRAADAAPPSCNNIWGGYAVQLPRIFGNKDARQP